MKIMTTVMDALDADVESVFPNYNLQVNEWMDTFLDAIVKQGQFGFFCVEDLMP